MKIAFLIVPCWGVTVAPLSIASLSAYVKSKGFESKCYDLNVELYSTRSGEFEDAWDLSRGYNNWEDNGFVHRFFEANKQSILNYLHNILSSKPDVISFTTYSTNLKLSLLIAKIIKDNNPAIKVVFGGAQMAQFLDSKKLIQGYDFIDAIFFGEGEESIVDYLNGQETVDGAVVKTDRMDSTGGIRKPIDIKTLPHPEYSDFNLKLYANLHGLSMWTSRGCLNDCFFCTEHEFMPGFRYRKAEDMFAEIKQNLKLYPNVNFFHFHDSVSNGNIPELEKLCKYIIDGSLKIRFSLDNVIMRKEMTLDFCKLLKQAGCVLVGYGMETCVPRLWGIMGKRVAFAQKVSASEIIMNTSRAGIRVGINVMFGIPGETEDDFQAQLQFIKDNRKRIYLVNPSLLFCLFPKGSKVYANPNRYNVNVSKGSLYWETKDRTNTYAVRQSRFLRFIKCAKELGIVNLFGDIKADTNADKLSISGNEVDHSLFLKNIKIKYAPVPVKYFQSQRRLIKRVLNRFHIIDFVNNLPTAIINKFRLYFCCDIDTRFRHKIITPHPVGIVFYPSMVGKNVTVYQGVTVGTKNYRKSKYQVPRIENNVRIYSNAVIAGDIVIGDNSTIGAGSIVFHDVPENTIVKGVY